MSLILKSPLPQLPNESAGRISEQIMAQYVNGLHNILKAK